MAKLPLHVPDDTGPLKSKLSVALGLFFVFTGVTHFVAPKPFLSIMPKWVPAPVPAVYLSGVAEMAGGLALMFPRTRKIAVIELIALLVLVFPANVQMLLWAEKFPIPTWLLWARLPMQPALIWLLWWLMQPSKTK